MFYIVCEVFTLFEKWLLCSRSVLHWCEPMFLFYIVPMILNVVKGYQIDNIVKPSHGENYNFLVQFRIGMTARSQSITNN